MLSYELNLVFGRSVGFAKDNRHEFLTIEHVFYMLLEQNDIKELLNSIGISDIDIDDVKNSLESYFEINYKKIPENINYEPTETLTLTRTIEQMILHIQRANKSEASLLDMIYFLFEEKNSYGAYLLCEKGVDKNELVNAIVEQSSVKTTTDENDVGFCINLIEEAKSGRIDSLVGRTNELERIMQILCRRKKNNPLLLGEPGVGKTAIVEGLAILIAEGKTPEILKNCRLFALDIGSLLAGTKYRGDFEKRLKEIIEKLTNTPDTILFIDEIHTIVGAGSTSGSSIDLSNLLKPYLSNGRLRCIGATTYQEYRNNFDKDRALSRRFATIDVQEPSVEETYKILLGLKNSYEKHHKVSLPNEVLKNAAELAKKYINDRFLPDSAIDLIDETCASFHLIAKKKETVKIEDIEKTLSKIANIPNIRASSNDKEILKTLSNNLKSKIFGQDSAIDVLTAAIKRSRAGLGNPTSPIGSFLFVGPTGVGKTEVAKQLAYELGIHFERYDMSEYMEKHAISRLIGSPPGYVGFEEGGQMTNSIKKHPYSVLLLDEVEKAHADLLNVLLQIFDSATLTDNSGKKTDFRNVIIIMTSNLGTKEASQVGFTKVNNDQTLRAVKDFFAPEFRNRLDAVVEFKSLGIAQMIKIVEKLLGEIEEQLKDKNVKIKITRLAKEYLAKKGFSATLGARQMRRVMGEEVKALLTDEILFGALKDGGIVEIGLKQNRLEFDFGQTG
ncbi:MAG: AAA family ATPase [Campylobacteraceae bacterium]|jgi:ATP-dependent Clp protease ATP-binding subunit ClpA|nr:AAA family ATPase [Campylobacteraceae bacterium]